eukprot:TRINITY_DN19905_c0_g1_i1.p1 TRINITY_DN19905_c0_g1~~TRINITY_DN19905_c0_g1_i1.p1  ORF type:complete len:395 (+),score=108.67 TRINITY_DN19905_c0_g1_i1:60-1187(+)
MASDEEASELEKSRTADAAAAAAAATAAPSTEAAAPASGQTAPARPAGNRTPDGPASEPQASAAALQGSTRPAGNRAAEAASDAEPASSSSQAASSRLPASKAAEAAALETPQALSSLIAGASLVVGDLRERFLRALRELEQCRQLLDERGIPHKSELSCKPEDHADVLQPLDGGPVVAATGALPAETEVATAATAAPAAATAATASAAPAQAKAKSEQPGLSPEAAEIAGVGVASSSQGPAKAGGLAAEQESSARRESERLEEELSTAKALLMLSNVSLRMDLDLDDEAGRPAPQVVHLKGSRKLIQCLIALKQKVALLNQQYLLLRGDMLYLNHEMNVCRHWILQSFRTAMQHQSQEHSSLQSRFERLSKVLN